MEKEPTAQRLTKMEACIAERVGQGMSAEAIAAELGVTEKVVRDHVHMILERLSVTRRQRGARAIRTARKQRDGFPPDAVLAALLERLRTS